jgi:transcriptional regulator with XRE-family HTH domain
MTTFRERIDEAARDKGLTRSALAKLLDMSRSNMTHWFGGRATNPKADAVARAADILGVNPLWLSSGKGPKHPIDREGKTVKPMKVKPDSDAGAILRMYDSMPAHIQPLARRQWRDLLEAYAPKSDANPFGKGDPPAFRRWRHICADRRKRNRAS